MWNKEGVWTREAHSHSISQNPRRRRWVRDAEGNPYKKLSPAAAGLDAESRMWILFDALSSVCMYGRGKGLVLEQILVSHVYSVLPREAICEKFCSEARVASWNGISINQRYLFLREKIIIVSSIPFH